MKATAAIRSFLALAVTAALPPSLAGGGKLFVRLKVVITTE